MSGLDSARSKDTGGSQSYFQVIEVDVPRTFPETKLFSSNGPLHGPLTEILRCYSLFSVEVGYVQGMSFLGAMLLFYMEDAYTAFKCLANILNTHFFTSLFMMDIPQILRHVRVYNVLFEMHMPKLFNKFTEFGISAEHYLLDWFMTIFGKSLPLEVSSRVWDCFLLDGEVFLYRTGLGILKKNEAMLLKSTFEQCILSLHEVSKSTREPGAAIANLVLAHTSRFAVGIVDYEELFNQIKLISVPSYVHAYIRKMEAEDQRTVHVSSDQITSIVSLSGSSSSATLSAASADT